MESRDSGPPPKKRFMNGNQEARSSDSRGRGRGGGGGFRGGRGGGFRGRGGSPGFRGGRGGSPGFRGGRGGSSGFRGRGESSGFRGRGGGGPPFRGRGGPSPFRGRDRSDSFREQGDGSTNFRDRSGPSGFRRGGPSSGPPSGSFRGRSNSFPRNRPEHPGIRSDMQGSPRNHHTLSIYNLPKKPVNELREVMKDVLSEYRPGRIDFKTTGQEAVGKATCSMKDEETLHKARSELNGRFVEDCQIIVTGSDRSSSFSHPLAITNLPDDPSVEDLVGILCDCKSIVQLRPFNLKASPTYTLVFVDTYDDVNILRDKKVSVKGNPVAIKVLNPAFVARSNNTLEYDKWLAILGDDLTYFIDFNPNFTDIYFEDAVYLNKALKIVESANKKNNESVDLKKRLVHGCFFAEVCDAPGDINDVELYTLMRKNGEISEFKRLDRDHYYIKQELSAALAAMSLSDSKNCGGVLKMSWSNTRIPVPAPVVAPVDAPVVAQTESAEEKKEKKKKKKAEKKAARKAKQEEEAAKAKMKVEMESEESDDSPVKEEDEDEAEVEDEEAGSDDELQNEDDDDEEEEAIEEEEDNEEEELEDDEEVEVKSAPKPLPKQNLIQGTAPKSGKDKKRPRKRRLEST